MSEGVTLGADHFRSPKRTKTIPLVDPNGPVASNDHNLKLTRSPKAPGTQGKFSTAKSHHFDVLQDGGKVTSATSVATTESCCTPHHSEKEADEHSVQIPEQTLPEAPRGDHEGQVPFSALPPTSQTSIQDTVSVEGVQLVARRNSFQGEDESEKKTVPVVDQTTAQSGEASTTSSSTEDSDSIYEHLDEFDPDELASILGDVSQPGPSGDESVEFRTTATQSDVCLEKEVGSWSAPPEPLRPPNPYRNGGVLLIQKHKPCPPFGPDYADYPGLRQGVKDKDLRTKTLVEICLDHPPMEGETAVDDLPRTLHIVNSIRVKEDGGAQLVSCQLDDEPIEYAAKIYDPLYYGFADRMWPDMPRDVAAEADKDYCREVAAYLELNERFGGSEVPRYHGSWTFCLSIDLPDGRRSRDVRMILMEMIQGNTMADLDPPPYSEKVRLEVLAQTLEAFNRFQAAGVLHRDIAQRNVMICDGKSATSIDRIVIVDFNFAVVTRLAEWTRRNRHQRLPEKPRNPIDDWWDCGGLYDGFGDWLPASWDRLYKPLQEWLYARWGNSNEFLPHKEPLIWESGE